MADDEVLNQRLQRIRKLGQLGELCLQHFKFDDHVPEQLAACSVGKRAIVSKLVNLANIVEEGSGEQQVAVYLRIIVAHQVAGIEKRDDMLKQSTDIGVVKRFGRRGIAISLSDIGIGHERLNQSFEVGIFKACDEACQGLPQLPNILGRLRQVIGKVNFRVSQTAKLVDRKLKAILVLVDQTFNLDEIILLKGVDGIIDVVPHFAFEVITS